MTKLLQLTKKRLYHRTVIFLDVITIITQQIIDDYNFTLYPLLSHPHYPTALPENNNNTTYICRLLACNRKLWDYFACKFSISLFIHSRKIMCMYKDFFCVRTVMPSNSSKVLNASYRFFVIRTQDITLKKVNCKQ